MSTSDAFILEDLINFYHLLAVFIYLFILNRLCLGWRAADLVLLSDYLLSQPTRVLQSLSLFFYIHICRFILRSLDIHII